MLRELGNRVVPAWAALESLADGRTQLVVVERVARGDIYGDQDIADWVRDARRLATLEHPNVARVRDVVIRGDEVLVVSEFIDGVRWSELMADAQRPSIEIALRVFVDALSGLSAVHNLRDAKREPLKLVHGELTPECLVVGPDGVGRVVSASRVKSATARPGRAGSAYLAPEVLLADESADARADVYGLGVMLWEALTGRPLFPNTQPSAIVTHLLSGRVPRATVPEGSAWAAPLADVAARALSADPEKRFASAAAFAAELRRIAGPKLPPPVRVAALVRGTWGDRIRVRRAELERGEVRAREVSGVAPPPGDDIPIDVAERLSGAPEAEVNTASTKPPPPLHPAPEPRPMAQPPPLPQGLAQPHAHAQPPPLPAPRPRLPTLAGVAPPAAIDHDVSGPGTPVVVPSSSRPPPAPPEAPAARPPGIAALHIPPAPLVPAELVETTGVPPAERPRHVVPVSPPATLPALPGVGASQHRNRRALTLALLFGPLVLAVLGVVVWLLARSPQPPEAATPPTPTHPATVMTAPAPPPPTAPAPSAVATPEPLPPSPPPPISVAAASTGDAPRSAASAPAAPSTTTPAWMTAPVPAAPPPRPTGKPKYEPEGI